MKLRDLFSRRNEEVRQEEREQKLLESASELLLRNYMRNKRRELTGLDEDEEIIGVD